MIYLIVKVLVYLLLAALVGGLLGWFLRNLRAGTEAQQFAQLLGERDSQLATADERQVALQGDLNASQQRAVTAQELAAAREEELADATKHLREHEAKLAQTDNALSDTTQKLNDTTDEAAALRSEVAALTDKLQVANENLAESLAQAAQSALDIEASAQRLAEHGERNNELTRELEDRQLELDRLAGLQDKVAQLKSELDEKDTSLARISPLAARLPELEASEAALQDAHQSSVGELQVAREEVRALRQQVESLVPLRGDLERQRSQLEFARQEQDQAAAMLVEAQAAAARVKPLEDELEAVRTGREAAVAGLAEMQMGLTQVESERASLDRALSERDSAVAALQQQIDDNDDKHALEARVHEIERELATLAEGEQSLQNLLAERDATLRELRETAEKLQSRERNLSVEWEERGESIDVLTVKLAERDDDVASLMGDADVYRKRISEFERSDGAARRDAESLAKQLQVLQAEHETLVAQHEATATTAVHRGVALVDLADQLESTATTALDQRFEVARLAGLAASSVSSAQADAAADQDLRAQLTNARHQLQDARDRHEQMLVEVTQQQRVVSMQQAATITHLRAQLASQRRLAAKVEVENPPAADPRQSAPDTRSAEINALRSTLANIRAQHAEARDRSAGALRAARRDGEIQILSERGRVTQLRGELAAMRQRYAASQQAPKVTPQDAATLTALKAQVATAERELHNARDQARAAENAAMVRIAELRRELEVCRASQAGGAGADGRPAMLLSSAPAEPDDLKRIRGVGPKLEGTLNRLGIYLFAQIAAFSDADIAWVDEHLEVFKGRVTRDNWVDQAKQLSGQS